MNQIVFRRAGVQDIPALTQLRILQLLEEGAKPFVDLHAPLHSYYEKHLSDGSFIACLAENSNQIVAVGGISFVEKPPYFANPTGKIGLLSSMYTIKNNRRKGLAKQLLEMVMKEAKASGCGTVYIMASEMGAKLYENCGFQRSGNFFQHSFY